MTHRIDITDPVAYREAATFAENNGCANDFYGAFGRLLNFMSGYAAIAETHSGLLRGLVWKDWAPHSFNWTVGLVDAKGAPIKKFSSHGRQSSCMYGGGLIYHGPYVAPDGTDGTLAVRIDPKTKSHEWLIHT